MVVVAVRVVQVMITMIVVLSVVPIPSQIPC
jgi:hypothetical protein